MLALPELPSDPGGSRGKSEREPGEGARPPRRGEEVWECGDWHGACGGDVIDIVV